MRRSTAFLIAAPVFGWAVYRAITVGITTAEAIAYNHYASQAVTVIFTAPYRSENQVLHTTLCWIALQVFRTSEWWFRAPSLLGFLLYFYAAYQATKIFCKPGWIRFFSFIVFAINPFTVAWLPVSSGAWMGAALFFLALTQLIPFLWEDCGDFSRLAKSSILLGMAGGFHLTFVVPAFMLVLLFLHFEFWNSRRVDIWTGVNRLLLPCFLVLFALWSLPLVAVTGPVRVDWLCVVLLPGFAVLSVPCFVSQQFTWKLIGPLTFVLALTAVFGSVPDLFHRGPESAMPNVARALRDRIRRSPARTVLVGTTENLVEALEFYRHRYALGAVQPIDLQLPHSSADYLILPSGAKTTGAWQQVVTSGNLVLFARDLP